jgi:hypothetical protein
VRGILGLGRLTDRSDSLRIGESRTLARIKRFPSKENVTISGRDTAVPLLPAPILASALTRWFSHSFGAFLRRDGASHHIRICNDSGRARRQVIDMVIPQDDRMNGSIRMPSEGYFTLRILVVEVFGLTLSHEHVVELRTLVLVYHNTLLSTVLLSHVGAEARGRIELWFAFYVPVCRAFLAVDNDGARIHSFRHKGIMASVGTEGKPTHPWVFW